MTPRYACPQCSSDRLEVSVSCWARLIQRDSGHLETDVTEAQDGSHEWTDESTMHCASCGCSATAAEFKPAGPCVKHGIQCNDEGLCPVCLRDELLQEIEDL